MKKSKYDLFLILKKLKTNKLLNNLSTLNNEKVKIEFAQRTLSEMLIQNNISKSDETSGLDLRQISAFRKNLMDKLEITNNRANHLSEEIKQNLGQVGKIEKQKEKIIEKKNKVAKIKENLVDLRKENLELRSAKASGKARLPY